MEIELKTKKWGNSIGVVIPKVIVEEIGIRADEKVTIDIKKRPLVKEFFGLLKDWKRPTQEIKDEMRAGWLCASDTLAGKKSK